ncbi:Gfo/Idh/MocA family oxidoreductase [Bradyrhizobium sp. 21]|uniref:Gfo/Idh/MocA family oxidoreductase n=1 Tax=Bradyrhizobium sp. 21 TaxID=2782666 RepID=UPI001FF8DC75|nr:Gfo/Idh/MocA family oxidoreductase [Bradyrhizobium sp. 21]MCK1387498.1 Gfo/Idh/MocA family oxidoreductase [Bradyrhizobium sp. 21]
MPEAPVFTILGSGFGMYGYLPALIECGIKVALPERYRAVVGGRSELAKYLPEVTWCADRDEALARATGAVVALRPADQADWMARLVETPGIRDLILEKPVAPTPQLAAQLVEAFERTGKRYRVGYTFRFLPWAEPLRAILAEGVDGLSLDWSFMAHHYRADLDNWKRFDASGGGALRFYGIHLIALLAELGYDDVSSSAVAGPSDAETASWEAVFTAKALPPFALRVDSRATQTCFRLTADGRGGPVIVDQLDPFASVNQVSVNARDARGTRDSRVDVLARLCRSLDEDDADHASRQRAIVALWTRIEAVSRRVSAT